MAWIEKTTARTYHRTPPPYWRWCEPHLRRTFLERCGWAGVFITSGQVEHFVSARRCLAAGGDLALIYDWENYRYVMPELNSSKQAVDGMLDPYDVQAGWFRLVLPSLRVELTDVIPDLERERAIKTLDRLNLEKHPKIVRLRETWLGCYRNGEFQIRTVRRFDPLLADALERLFAAPVEQLTEPARGLRERIVVERRRAGLSAP
ncbi:hypothetical protein DB30_03251 [Enhygromyxa salina]|uniref:Uncharacterized protein n=1 Tax=Enhygromyxa salina TaxID=215803 RepID=A0A0C2D7D8_9BACT|nr:hypothetical protein [Enhygromyxa salina]KIG17550.1 hypothetical protein DB30_03251 [Enhygromyxa salina]